jgi:HAD superfamily hydrolase (TIGR01549 family)
LTENIETDYRRITTVIFDMDGTLIEHTWQLNQLMEALFASFADKLAPISIDDFFETFWPKAEDMWYMMVDGVLSGDLATRYSYVNTLRVLGQDTSLAGDMVDTWREVVLNEVKPFADTLTVLDALRPHYTTGIVTNGYMALQQAKIKRYHLAEHVDFTLISEAAGYHKPDPRIFYTALQLAGQPTPAQTLYIGDNPTTDIQGARAAGLIPIFFNPNDDPAPPAGVVKIKRLSELLTFLPLSIS